MGIELFMDLVMGSVGCLVLLVNLDMVKMLVIELVGMLVVRGVFDWDNSLMLDEVVDVMMRRFWRLGLNFCSCSSVWWGVFLRLNGKIGFVIFWKVKDVVLGFWVMIWYIDFGGELLVVWMVRKRWFFS